MNAPYRHRLAIVCRERRGPVLSRALLGLGPELHVPSAVIISLWAGTLVNVPLMLLAVSGVTGHWLVPSVLLRVTLPLLIVTFAWVLGLSVTGRLHRSRREQALLVLLPGMPRGSALNIGIARRLMRQFLGVWVVGLVVVLTVASTLAAPLRAGLVAFVFVQLWSSAVLCRDWSTMRGSVPEMGALPVLVTLAVPFVAAGLNGLFDIPAGWFAIALTLLAVVSVAPRWARLRKWPSAWPTGRRA